MTKAIFLRIITNHYTTTISDSALTFQILQGLERQGLRRCLRVCIATICLALLFPVQTSAQTPFPSYAYVIGKNPAVDLAGPGKTVGGDGIADTWVAFVHRNLRESLAHGSGYYVKWMKLYHPTLPGYRWDTIPGSSAPLLVVTQDQGRTILNHGDGSIDGLMLTTEGRLDLYFSDPSFRVAANLPGLILEIGTTDGTIRIAVDPTNFHEHLY